MRTIILAAAAFATIGAVGTAAVAQMPMKQSTTVATPAGTATTTTRTHTDGMSGRTDERTTVRSKSSTVTRPGRMARWRSIKWGQVQLPSRFRKIRRPFGN